MTQSLDLITTNFLITAIPAAAAVVVVVVVVVAVIVVVVVVVSLSLSLLIVVVIVSFVSSTAVHGSIGHAVSFH